MSRKSVTEEDLGIQVTEEEMTAASPPSGDDISMGDDPAQQPAATEAPEAQAAAPEPKAEEPKTVDLRALQEARSEAREARQRAAVLEQRWNDFLSGQNTTRPEQPAPQQPQMPGDEDPMGQLQWLKEQAIARQEREAAAERQTVEQTREQQETQRAIDIAQQQYLAAEAADPTVPQAYAALQASFARELQALGYTPQQIQQQYRQTEAGYIRHAVARGIPIGDFIKGLATARGWTPQAAQAVPQKQPDMAALAETQQRHMSLSDAPGGEAPVKLDAKAIAKMTDKQFKAFMSRKGSEAELDEILGAA